MLMLMAENQHRKHARVQLGSNSPVRMNRFKIGGSRMQGSRRLAQDFTCVSSMRGTCSMLNRFKIGGRCEQGSRRLAQEFACIASVSNTCSIHFIVAEGEHRKHACVSTMKGNVWSSKQQLH